MTVEDLRKRMARLEDRALKLPAGIRYQQETLVGLHCDRLLNDGAKFTLLHIYGGAGCVRTPKGEMPALARFCQSINAEAFLPWYSLAPEHKFPAAAEECLAAYKALLEQGVDPKHLVLSGSSAGGGYLLGLLLQLKEHELPMPACALFFSPSGDSLFVGDSWHTNARRDPCFRLADVLYFQDLLLSPQQRSDPRINVSLVNDFSGYPPLYFCASSTEILRDVSTIAHQKAQAAGIESQLDIFPGGLHCLPVMLPGAKQSKVIWQRIESFVQKQLPQTS